MTRSPEHLRRQSLLDDHAEIHYRDAVADVVHGAEVMRNEEIGGAARLLNLEQEVDDFGARGRVERRGRLVKHHQGGLSDDGAGDADPLLLPRAQRGPVLTEHGGPQVDPPAYRLDAAGALAGRHAQRLQRLLDRIRDAHSWIERLRRLLKDKLNLAAQMRFAHVVLARELFTLEQDTSAGRLLETEDAASDRGFARP